MTSRILWHEGRTSSDDALRAHVGALLGTTEQQVRVGRQCRRCGSDGHGRPWVRLPDGPSPHVSLARCGDHLVTAVSLDGPIGIDVESVAAVTSRWDARIVLHPSESADTPQERTAMWCRKEAVLKASGDGLEVAMSGIRCLDWDVTDVPAPSGLWASLARLGQAGSGGRSTS